MLSPPWELYPRDWAPPAPPPRGPLLSRSQGPHPGPFLCGGMDSIVCFAHLGLLQLVLSPDLFLCGVPPWAKGEARLQEIRVHTPFPALPFPLSFQ